METVVRLAIVSLSLLLVVVPTSRVSGQSLLHATGGVEIWALPGDAPANGVFATQIMLSTSEENSIERIDQLSFSGPLHQVWSSDEPQTVTQPRPSFVFPESWIPFDSHLLIGSGEGIGLENVTESNDGASDLLSPTDASAIVGFGGIELDENKAIELDPSLQSNTVLVAYLATREANPGAVTMTLGVSGAGIGDPNGQVLFENVPILFSVPEPTATLLLQVGAVLFLGLRNRGS